MIWEALLVQSYPLVRKWTNASSRNRWPSQPISFHQQEEMAKAQYKMVKGINIFLVCREIHDEATQVFHEKNTFSLHSTSIRNPWPEYNDWMPWELALSSSVAARYG